MKRTVIPAGGAIYQQKGAWLRLEYSELSRLVNWYSHKRLSTGCSDEDNALLAKIEEASTDIAKKAV
jgi:hypothetical protein